MRIASLPRPRVGQQRLGVERAQRTIYAHILPAGTVYGIEDRHAGARSSNDVKQYLGTTVTSSAAFTVASQLSGMGQRVSRQVSDDSCRGQRAGIHQLPSRVGAAAVLTHDFQHLYIWTAGYHRGSRAGSSLAGRAVFKQATKIWLGCHSVRYHVPLRQFEGRVVPVANSRQVVFAVFCINPLA